MGRIEKRYFYRKISLFIKGGFNWRLNFRWYPVPQREEVRRNRDHSLPLLYE
jgi:hypothetical protein